MVGFNKYSYGVGVWRRADKKYLLDRKPRLSRVLWPLLLTPPPTGWPDFWRGGANPPLAAPDANCSPLRGVATIAAAGGEF
jgi:hypothetical protein